MLSTPTSPSNTQIQPFEIILHMLWLRMGTALRLIIVMKFTSPLLVQQDPDSGSQLDEV
jgi:hypothetical protein